MKAIIVSLLAIFSIIIASDPKDAVKNNQTKRDSVIIYVMEEKLAEKSHKYSFQIINNSDHSLGQIYFGIIPGSGESQFGGNWEKIKSTTPDDWSYGQLLREEGEFYIDFFAPKKNPLINFPIKPGDTLNGLSVILDYPDTTYRNCFFSISARFNTKEIKIRDIEGVVTFKEGK